MNVVPSITNTASNYDTLFALEKDRIVESDISKTEISAHLLKANAATFGALGLATLCQRMGIWAKAATR